MEAKTLDVCPQCGEPIRPGWRLCPVCEIRLGDLMCPGCKGEVEEHWRRCPVCETQLVCGTCGARMGPGQDGCGRCEPAPPEEKATRPVIEEPVCGMEFVLVRGGTYAMGDTLDQGVENERPIHEVSLDDFRISRFPVTQKQWSALMGENPSAFQHDDHPVEQVTWTDASDFAQKLTRAAQTGGSFMLPTEAQWEYAARSGGLDDLYAGGDDIDRIAWYEGNSKGSTHPVGLKMPNALGLHDMSGNVWEWCRDTFRSAAYGHHGCRNPVVASGGRDRVIRGGSWNLDAWSARCSRRFNFSESFYRPGLGFRLVLSAHP